MQARAAMPSGGRSVMGWYARRGLTGNAHVLGPDHGEDLRLYSRASLHRGQRAEHRL
jgi:hypothetical protein